MPSSPDFISNPGPSGRGWTDLVWVNSAHPSSDSSLLFMFGGTGTLDGSTTSIHAHDLDDTWLWNVTANQWLGARTGACVQNVTLCTDAASYFSLAQVLQQITANLTAIGGDASLRPAQRLTAAAELSALSQAFALALNVGQSAA